MFCGLFGSDEPQTPAYATVGSITRICFVVAGILISCFGECVPSAAHKGGITAVFQKNLSHTILFVILRLFLQIPGMYCMLFYYGSMAILGLKLLMTYEAIHCPTSRTVFQIILALAVVAITVGFQEKIRGCFLPSTLLIDLLALAIAVRVKPWVMLQVCRYTGYNFQGFHSPKVQQLITWISDGIVIFVAGRLVGMMLYCSGIISEPCKYSELTLFG